MAALQAYASGSRLCRVECVAMKLILRCLLFLGTAAACLFAQAAPSAQVDSVFPDARALYLELHQHPELSGHEVQTAATMAAKLRALGYEVTEHFGNTGIVAVLKNGAGPAIMLRTELDALPVQEKTGLPYASSVHTKDDAGLDVPVMHACGHDLHMAALYATAAIMARTRQSWHGTLLLIGQPAEETINGASGMVKEGLFTRFPRPDAIVALHVYSLLPAGEVGVVSGIYDSNADSIRVTIYGKGGHGSAPHTAVDPIVIAARTILARQTITSREVKPGEMAVVTVGYIRAGTKNNIIPDQAEMGLTVRSYKPEVRKQVLASIDRITRAEAEAAGAPRPPSIEEYEATDAVFNNAGLAQHLKSSLIAALGKQNVIDDQPLTGSEDFSVFLESGIPGFYLSLGGADPDKFAKAKAAGTALPSNHSSLFAPDLDPSLRTAITAEVSMLTSLLNSTSAEIKKMAADAAH